MTYVLKYKKRIDMKLKLNNLSKSVLNNREMKEVKGGAAGDTCQCGCCYEGEPGGSSTSANAAANAKTGLESPCGTKITVLAEVIIDGQRK